MKKSIICFCVSILLHVIIFALTHHVYAADKVVVVPLASSSNQDIQRGFSVVKTGTGRYWMDRNLGALRPAARENDPDSWGDLYQWGRFGDGHQHRFSPTSLTQLTTPTPYSPYLIVWTPNWLNHDDFSLWQGVNGVNNPCPKGFRLPTKEEWQAEISSWNSTTASSAMNSPLKLTLGGIRDALGTGGSYKSPTTAGFYWSSSVSPSGSAYSLEITEVYGAQINMYSRSEGMSVRCIQN